MAQEVDEWVHAAPSSGCMHVWSVLLDYLRPTDRAGPWGCRTWGTKGMVVGGPDGRWKGDDDRS
jgi:hypothetical protein